MNVMFPKKTNLNFGGPITSKLLFEPNILEMFSLNTPAIWNLGLNGEKRCEGRCATPQMPTSFEIAETEL
jgi:hypothetical protein